MNTAAGDPRVHNNNNKNPPECSGEWWCSIQDVTCGDHVRLFKEHQRRLLSPKALFGCVFFVCRIAFSSWDICFLVVSFGFLGFVSILGWSVINMARLDSWVFTRGMAGATGQKVWSVSHGYFHSHIQPLQRMSRDYPEISACLKAACVLNFQLYLVMFNIHYEYNNKSQRYRNRSRYRNCQKLQQPHNCQALLQTCCCIETPFSTNKQMRNIEMSHLKLPNASLHHSQ